METNELQVQAESNGVSFKLTLKNFYCGFGGQIEVQTILNAGTPDEKILPPTTSSVNNSLNGEFYEEGRFQEFIQDNPEVQELVRKAIEKAAEPYQS